MHKLLSRLSLGAVTASAMVLAAAAPAAAHPHRVVAAHQGAGQVLANSANHGAYSTSGVTCGGDPAAYGLETAHHGPDSGTSGNGDGCYQLDSMPPGSDISNPVIR